MHSHFNSEKMFTFLRGYANGKGMPETLHALNYARKLHKGQMRDGGEPYIIHPLTMAFQAISMGLNSDELVAAALLHDVVEDCGVEIENIPCNNRVKEIVLLLTFREPKTYKEKSGRGSSIESLKEQYYNLISRDAEASLVKLLDRCNNVSSMAGVFSEERLISYIEETKRYILPLIKRTKEEFPEYQNSLFILKYHIYSVLEAICCTINSLAGEQKVSVEDIIENEVI